MKEIQVIKYESTDGKIFDKKEECLLWEKTLAVSIEDLQVYINNFLSKSQNYEEWIRDELNKSGNFIQCCELSIDNNKCGIINLTLGYSYEDEYGELYENFSIDMEKWYNFEDEIKEKFGCFISISSSYWPK